MGIHTSTRIPYSVLAPNLTSTTPQSTPHQRNTSVYSPFLSFKHTHASCLDLTINTTRATSNTRPKANTLPNNRATDNRVATRNKATHLSKARATTTSNSRATNSKAITSSMVRLLT